MSSQSTILFLYPSPKGPQTPPSLSTQKYAGGVPPFKAKDKWVNGNLNLKCKAILKPQTQEINDRVDVFQNGAPEGYGSIEIKKHVDTVRSMLSSMEDGEISISAYDTAWVALVKDINGTDTPQFPSSLLWIANNQLEDGSWGDVYFFSPYDRILNTLACVIALKSWNIHPEKFEKGMSFIRENICKLEKEKAEHMPIGFEVAFPSLLEIAEDMGIEVPDDSPVLQEIYAQRDLKLKSWIPKDIMHGVPTGLLFSLEGMLGLDWEMLLNLQFQDGSFCVSPSSTAYALMHTKDEKCLTYLNKVVERFNGERLGISRYFEPEIKVCMNYVYRYWNKNGICWARNTRVSDVDDTSMGFRLLRLHGYDVSPDVFKQFEKGDEFVCFPGQSSQAITGLFNLFRASQFLLPGEKILENRKQTCNQLEDKWIIAKDLAGEIGYALDIPWYASLPRVETRFYVEQYGGGDDIWIGKTFYRMYHVNNDIYSELAKLDFNNCQELHQLEWDRIQEWWTHSHLQEFGLSRETLLLAYFLAAASIFEPERSVERVAWAKAAVLVEAVASYFNKETCIKQRRAFLLKFGYSASGGRYRKINGSSNLSKTGEELAELLLTTLNQLSLDAQELHGSDIHQLLHHTWEMWLTKNLAEEDGYQGEAEVLVDVINLCSGRSITEELLNHPLYKHLLHLTSGVSHQLSPFYQHKEHNGSYKPENDSTVDLKLLESDMQELVQLRTFLMVAKSFYYAACCDPPTISSHIAKVFFESVV
ncbi:hypothetical protein AAG906_034738 [Vitis piasezkii]